MDDCRALSVVLAAAKGWRKTVKDLGLKGKKVRELDKKVEQAINHLEKKGGSEWLISR